MERVASLAGGLKLPYVERGSGVPVVLLHAWADSWRSFERVLPHLPEGIRAVAPTQRGHGDADRPASGYAVEDFSEDLAALMDALAIDSAVLVASSSAAFTVRRFAADRPERTLGLVLVGAPERLRGKPEVERMRDAIGALEDPIDPAFVRDIVASMTSGAVPADHLETLVGECLKVPARVWKSALDGLLEAADLPALDVPALVIWGDADSVLTRADQEQLVASIPGSRLTVYEGAGHVVHWEQPARVAADIAAFAAEVAADRRGMAHH